MADIDTQAIVNSLNRLYDLQVQAMRASGVRAGGNLNPGLDTTAGFRQEGDRARRTQAQTERQRNALDEAAASLDDFTQGTNVAGNSAAELTRRYQAQSNSMSSLLRSTDDLAQSQSLLGTSILGFGVQSRGLVSTLSRLATDAARTNYSMNVSINEGMQNLNDMTAAQQAVFRERFRAELEVFRQSSTFGAQLLRQLQAIDTDTNTVRADLNFADMRNIHSAMLETQTAQQVAAERFAGEVGGNLTAVTQRLLERITAGGITATSLAQEDLSALQAIYRTLLQQHAAGMLEGAEGILNPVVEGIPLTFDEFVAKFRTSLLPMGDLQDEIIRLQDALSSARLVGNADDVRRADRALDAALQTYAATQQLGAGAGPGAAAQNTLNQLGQMFGSTSGALGQFRTQVLNNLTPLGRLIQQVGTSNGRLLLLTGGIDKVIGKLAAFGSAAAIAGKVATAWRELEDFNIKQVPDTFLSVHWQALRMGMAFGDMVKLLQENKPFMAVQGGAEGFDQTLKDVGKTFRDFGYTTKQSAEMFGPAMTQAFTAGVNVRDRDGMNRYIKQTMNNFQRLAGVVDITAQEYMRQNAELTGSGVIFEELMGLQGEARTARANELIALKDNYQVLGLQKEEAMRLVQLQAEQRRTSFRERFGKAGRMMAGALGMGFTTQQAMRLNQLERSGYRTPEEDTERLELLAKLQQLYMERRGPGASEAQRAIADIIAEAGGFMNLDPQTQAALKMLQARQQGKVPTREEQDAAARAAQGAKAVGDVMEGFNIFKAMLQNSLPGMLAASAAALGAHLLATIASTAALNALAGASARAAIASGAAAAAPLARGIGRAGLGGLAGAAIGGGVAAGAGALGAGSGAQTGAQIGAVVGGIAGSVIPGLGTIFGTLIGTAGGGLIGAIVDEMNATGVKEEPTAQQSTVAPASSPVPQQFMPMAPGAMLKEEYGTIVAKGNTMIAAVNELMDETTKTAKSSTERVITENNQAVNRTGEVGALSISGFTDLLGLVKETNSTLSELVETAKGEKVVNLKLPTSTYLPEQRRYYSVKA